MTASVEDVSRVTIEDILYVVFKYKWRILAIFVGAVLGTLAYLVIAGPTYEGVTKILVQLGREKAGGVETATSNPNFVFAARSEDIRDEIEILADTAVAQAVLPALKEWLDNARRPPQTILDHIRSGLSSAIRTLRDLAYEPLYLLGLAPRLTADQQFALSVHAALTAELVEETDVIRVRFRWSNPQFAAFAANAFAEEYVRRRIQIYTASGGERFYVEQIRLYQSKLEDVERQIQEFRKSHGISDLTLQRELLLREISQLNRDNETAAIALQDLQVKRERARRTYEKTAEWPETPVVGELVPNMTALDARYVTVLADRNRLLDTYDPNSRTLQSQNAQIEMLRQQKFQALDSVIGAQVASVTSRRDLIGAALAQKQASLADLNRSMATLRDLERQRALIEQDYSLYAKKVEEFRISEALSKQRITSVRILGPAVAPDKPVKPSLSLTMALAALLSLFVGFAYATIAEYFDHSFRGTNDVKAVLGVPLLASIPDAKYDAMAADPPVRG